MRISTVIGCNLPMTGTISAWVERDGGEALDALCCRIAADILRTRGMRSRFLADFHLAEPVWDMLLDLYVAEAKGRPVSVLDLAIAAAVPRSTGVRWVGTLVAEGKLKRHDDPLDGRRSWLTLSAEAKAALENYLVAMAKACSPDRKVS